MTSAAESKVLVHTGPGTPMGALMREYWIPACLSSELESGAPPMRLLLLGEKLVAFRDGAGKAGILDQRCPHRCASLFFGRNEADGVRCAYHGWKFAVDGRCIEMPNVPPSQDFKHKVSAKAYPVVERNGLVWAYMGARAEPPPLPMLEPTLLAAEDVTYRVFQRECNWLQALEGDIDTSHFGFLHGGSVRDEDLDMNEPSRFALLNRAPEYHAQDTEWGTMYAAYRPADTGSVFYRVAHFLFPFWTYLPEGVFRDNVIAQAWVPMDDTHTMVYQLAWRKRSPPPRSLKSGGTIPGLEPKYDYLPNTSDWYGRWRFVANRGNDYLIDRAAQRTTSYTGITGVSIQDQAITESMGGITDHEWEHLGPSDRMITLTRRRLLRAVQALAGDGTLPPLVDSPAACLAARAGSFVAPEALGWLEAYGQEMGRVLNPTAQLKVSQSL